MTRMGDLIQSTPAIAGLRNQYPGACITLMVTSAFEEFSKKIPHIDKRVVFDIRQFEDRKNLNGFLWIELYRYLESLLNDLKANEYDLLINLSHSKLSALMISYLGIKNMRGFGCNGNGERITLDPWMQYFGTEPFNRMFNPFNLVEIFTRSAGVSPEDNPIRLVANSVDSESVREITSKYNIKEGDFVIGIQAGSSLEGRRWSPEAFAELADGLIESLGAKIILFGVNSEKLLAEKIISCAQHKDSVIDLTGKTNIDQLATLVKRCSYLVSNDTGTMHIAAAVGTTIIGLFFAHAHPFETAPYSSGHLIFQARIPCAPCSYGVECNNVVCVRKVLPEHLLSMIQNHLVEGDWRITDSMSGLEEVNIFNTYLGEDRRLRLRPLIKYSLTLNDIFREIYTDHWLYFLGRVKVNESTHCDIGDLLLREYDCSNTSKLSMQIEEILCILRSLGKLASKGICNSDEIIQICSGDMSTKINMVKVLADKIEKLDEKIGQIGFVHPELKSITDMFTKRKENIQDNDPVQLAKDTKKCYQSLLEEGISLGGSLISVLKTLKSANADVFQAAVSSINVEVPGR